MSTLKHALASSLGFGTLAHRPAASEARKAQQAPAARLAAAEVVVPKELEAAAKRRFEDELYELHGQIFRGVEKAAFVKYVIDSKAEHTWIQLYRGDGGELGGYFAVHVFEREVGGELTAIVRCEMGTLRKYRGGNVMFSFMVDRMLRYLVAHPLRPLYILGSLVHPSSYAQLSRYTDEVWPRAEAETPAEILDLMDQLGDTFGLDRVDPDNALVRKVGWQTMDSADDRAYWERSERRGVQYFLRQNPGYGEGHGLLTLAPVSLRIVARGLGTYARHEGERRARKLATRARAGIAAILPARPAAAAAA